MSVKKVEMFTVVCDNCQKSADEGTCYSCWSDENGAQEVAMEASYLMIKDNHYCPDCYEYDDKDELMIKYKSLSVVQKQQALSLKYYDCLEWKPKKGDYYTTSRNDLELYQIVDENESSLFTNYCDEKKSPQPQEWKKSDFLIDFGERRVYVPDFILHS